MEKAVILAAGRGTRMGELTDERPKPMIELRGKPLLEHILDRLRAAGFTKAFLVTGYKAEMIESYFRNYPMEIAFGRQQTMDGTAHAALLAREWVGSDAFLLTYGDILTEAEDYAAMVSALGDHAAVLSVKWVDDPWQGAAVYVTGHVVTRIIEKPGRGTSSTHWNSAGGYIFRNEIFEEFAGVPKSVRGEYEITSGIERLLGGERGVVIHALRGEWRDVGRPDDLAIAEGMVE